MFAVATYGWFVRAVSPNICVCRIDEIRHDGLSPHNEDFFRPLSCQNGGVPRTGLRVPWLLKNCPVGGWKGAVWSLVGVGLGVEKGQFGGREGSVWGAFRGVFWGMETKIAEK